MRELDKLYKITLKYLPQLTIKKFNCTIPASEISIANREPKPVYNQVIYYLNEKRLGDAASCYGLYGYEAGLLEIAGFNLEEGDVQGWLTALEVYEIILDILGVKDKAPFLEGAKNMLAILEEEERRNDQEQKTKED